MASYAAIEIFRLHEEDKLKIQNKLARNNSHLLKIFDVLCKHPIVSIKELQILTSIDSYVTVSRCLKTLQDLEIIFMANTNKRNKKFVYKKYLDILKKDTIASIG